MNARLREFMGMAFGCAWLAAMGLLIWLDGVALAIVTGIFYLCTFLLLIVFPTIPPASIEREPARYPRHHV